MGTTSEWRQVLEVGAIFGVLMFARDAVTDPNFAKRSNIVGILAASFLFGMMLIFEWRVLRPPIVFVFAPGIIALVLSGLAARHSRKRGE